jgi:lipoate-protein ligase B
MIRILRDYGITGERNKRNRGVWVGNEKIGFIGIAIRRRVSFHGIALNVDPDLSFFDLINPCGLSNVRATSMGLLLQRKVLLQEVKDRAVFHFRKVFDLSVEKMEPDSFISNIPDSGAAISAGAVS